MKREDAKRFRELQNRKNGLNAAITEWTLLLLQAERNIEYQQSQIADARRRLNEAFDELENVDLAIENIVGGGD